MIFVILTKHQQKSLTISVVVFDKKDSMINSLENSIQQENRIEEFREIKLLQTSCVSCN